VDWRQLRRRSFSFFLDWLVWGYVAYGVVYLLTKYWWEVPLARFLTPIPIPAWGWPLVILGTLETAVWSRALGRSLGLRAFGLALNAPANNRPSLRAKLRRGLLWHLNFTPLGFFYLVREGKFIQDVKSGLEVGPPPDLYPGSRSSPLRDQWAWTALLVVVLTLWVGWLVVEADLGTLIARWDKAGQIYWGKVRYDLRYFLRPTELPLPRVTSTGLLKPDFRYLLVPDPAFELRRLSASILDLMVVTVFMALLATVLGVVLAFPLSFLGARNIMGFSPVGWMIYFLVRGFFNVFRSIPTIMWTVLFAVWVGWGSPFAGVLGLTLHTIAALGKLYSEQVEGIDPGPVEAVVAAGGSRLEVIRYAVIPQISPSYWAFTLYRWDINVRMSTVIALVGGGGIGDMLFYHKDKGNWELVGAVVVVIVAVVWAMDYISGRLRERIV